MNSDLSLGVYLQTIGVEPNRHNSFPNCLDAISNLLNSINAEFMSACVRSIQFIDVLTHTCGRPTSRLSRNITISDPDLIKNVLNVIFVVLHSIFVYLMISVLYTNEK